MEKTCNFCPNSHPRMVEANHWIGTEYIRVSICNDCYADGNKLQKAPRQPRRKRQTHIVATDWNMLAAFSQKNKK